MKHSNAVSVRDVLLVFLIALLFQLVAVHPFVGLYDEGLILTGADLVLDGKVPYRDFWTMYGPAQFYLTAWAYSIFGHADWVARAVGIVAESLIVSFSYVIVVRLAPRGYALVTASVILLSLISARQYAFPVFPAVAFSLLAIILVEKSFRSGGKYLFFAGLSTGAIIGFRHDLGAYSALGITSSLLTANFIYKGTSTTKDVLLSTLYKVFIYGLGISIIFIPMAGLLLYAVPLADLNENLIQIPSKIYPAVRSLPFPIFGINRIAPYVVYLPFITVLWVLAVEYLHAVEKGIRKTTRMETPATWALLTMLLTMCLLFTIKGLVRVQFLHMIQSIILAAVLLAVYTKRVNWNSTVARFLLMPAYTIILILLWQPVLQGAKEIVRGGKGIIRGDSTVVANCISPPLPRLQCVGVDEYYLQAAKFVMANSEPADKIYVGTTQHRKLYLNAVSFYFMVGRQPVTKWYDLHPGVQTQKKIQLEMIKEMDAHPPKLIVLDSQWDNVDEPNESRFSTGASELDNYIKKNYLKVKEFGTLEILEAREIRTE